MHSKADKCLKKLNDVLTGSELINLTSFKMAWIIARTKNFLDRW